MAVTSYFGATTAIFFCFLAPQINAAASSRIDVSKFCPTFCSSVHGNFTVHDGACYCVISDELTDVEKNALHRGKELAKAWGIEVHTPVVGLNEADPNDPIQRLFRGLHSVMRERDFLAAARGLGSHQAFRKRNEPTTDNEMLPRSFSELLKRLLSPGLMEQPSLVEEREERLHSEQAIHDERPHKFPISHSQGSSPSQSSSSFVIISPHSISDERLKNPFLESNTKPRQEDGARIPEPESHVSVSFPQQFERIETILQAHEPSRENGTPMLEFKGHRPVPFSSIIHNSATSIGRQSTELARNDNQQETSEQEQEAILKFDCNNGKLELILPPDNPSGVRRDRRFAWFALTNPAVLSKLASVVSDAYWLYGTLFV